MGKDGFKYLLTILQMLNQIFKKQIF